jgi:hypothetical protein
LGFINGSFFEIGGVEFKIVIQICNFRDGIREKFRAVTAMSRVSTLFQAITMPSQEFVKS